MGARRGNVICFFNTKGGVGRTTLAVNLAVSFGLSGFTAVMVDFDLQSGNAEQLLGLTPDKTIADLIATRDWASAPEFVTEYNDRVGILAAPPRPELDIDLDISEATEILTALRGSYSFVVVDLPSTFGGRVSAAVECSDLVCLLTSADILSIKNTVFTLQYLALLGFELQAVRLVANKVDNAGMTVVETEQAVGMKAFRHITRDKAVATAANKRVPFVVQTPRSAAAVALRRMALAIAIEFGVTRGHS